MTNERANRPDMQDKLSATKDHTTLACKRNCSMTDRWTIEMIGEMTANGGGASSPARNHEKKRQKKRRMDI